MTPKSRDVAHRLKGSSAIMGATRMAALSADLEHDDPARDAGGLLVQLGANWSWCATRSKASGRSLSTERAAVRSRRRCPSHASANTSPNPSSSAPPPAEARQLLRWSPGQDSGRIPALGRPGDDGTVIEATGSWIEPWQVWRGLVGGKTAGRLHNRRQAVIRHIRCRRHRPRSEPVCGASRKDAEFTVSVQSAAVRKAPSTGSPVVGQAARGAVLEVDARHRGVGQGRVAGGAGRASGTCT